MVRKIIIEADTKKQAFRRVRRGKRIVFNNKLFRLVPISARRTNREGIFEVTVRKSKRRS